ncbi:MAG: hypothetical protein QNJ54_27650 [Prochloraceae cyanobacterium]|nr:hypothetical protein [Prochloraceae cyanobacterium]
MNDKTYKIYFFLNYEVSPEKYLERPRNIDLKKDLTIRPVKKDTIELGERTLTEYYEKFENGEYLNPLLCIDHKFIRDTNGLVLQRDTIARWVYDDDSLEEGLSTTKYFVTESEKYEEIKRRRYNIVYINLIPLATELGLGNEVVAFFEANQTLVNTYIDAGSNALLAAVGAMTDEWIDRTLPTGNTPRQALQLYLQIGALTI